MTGAILSHPAGDMTLDRTACSHAKCSGMYLEDSSLTPEVTLVSATEVTFLRHTERQP